MEGTKGTRCRVDIQEVVQVEEVRRLGGRDERVIVRMKKDCRERKRGVQGG